MIFYAKFFSNVTVLVSKGFLSTHVAGREVT